VSSGAEIEFTPREGFRVSSTNGVDLDTLKEKARVLRQHIVRMTTEAGSGHPSSSMSATEVVTALYFGGFLNYDAADPNKSERDRFILSKGHAVPVLYAAMAEAGYFPVDDLMSLRKLGSPLEGHPNMRRLAGIEASTGSLGQGLSLGVGQALGCRLDGLPSRVFVMMGDGEMGEGQVWEAIASAHKYELGNLTAIIDQNGYQQTGATKDVLDLTPFAEKIATFGWHTQTISGNDMAAVVTALEEATAVTDRPSLIVSETKKGFGILPLMEAEGDLNFHGKPLSPELAEKALELLA
jgi:transketolase